MVSARDVEKSALTGRRFVIGWKPMRHWFRITEFVAQPPPNETMNDKPNCPLGAVPDYSGVIVAELAPPLPLADYLEAMKLADAEATARLGDHMLLSWYDCDRDFESPQHSSECNSPGAMPGYAVYGLYHGATLMVNVEQGRFVFFYLPLD
jgi:hypothetical protein